MNTLIAAKTAAETSDTFDVRYNNALTLVANGLGESEEIDVQIECLPGEFTAAYDYFEEIAYVLKSTANIIVISAPGRYRIVKPITAGSVSVGVHGMAG